MVSWNSQMAKHRQSIFRWCKDVAWCPHYLHLEVFITISEMLCVYCMAPGQFSYCNDQSTGWMTKELIHFPSVTAIFLIYGMPRLALVPIPPPIEWLLRALASGVRQLGHEADHLPPSGVQVKNDQTYASCLPYACMAHTGTNFVFVIFCVYR